MFNLNETFSSVDQIGRTTAGLNPRNENRTTLPGLPLVHVNPVPTADRRPRSKQPPIGPFPFLLLFVPARRPRPFILYTLYFILHTVVPVGVAPCSARTCSAGEDPPPLYTLYFIL